MVPIKVLYLVIGKIMELQIFVTIFLFTIFTQIQRLAIYLLDETILKFQSFSQFCVMGISKALHAPRRGQENEDE
jgi:hypothetical protein